MTEELEVQVVEHAPAQPDAPAPVLVVLPDPEAPVDLGRPVLGHPPGRRLASAATDAGFASVCFAPGTKVVPPGATEVATGEGIGSPALVVFEASSIHPQLLTLMVEHPLEPDERFTLYDAAGRPTGWFSGDLDSVPATMPISEELDWPEELGPPDIARYIYDEDRPRVEALILRSERVFDLGASRWHELVSLPSIRWLGNSGRPLAQIELGALALAVASGPLALLGTHGSLVAAGICLLVGVHISQLLGVVRRLQEGRGGGTGVNVPGESLARATRPLAHAAATAGMTYLLVSETDRTGVAGLVLLAAGAGAVLLSLGHARRLLRDQPTQSFALPDAGALATRLGVTVPRWLVGAPLLEIGVVLATVPGLAGPPWAVLAAGGLARLWRWFTGSGVVTTG